MMYPPLPAALAADLSEVDQVVRERARSRAAVISAADPYLLRPGEDRLRAVFVLLSAQLGTYHLERVVHAAAAIELIRAATRTHTNLVDEAERRLGHARQGDWNHGVSLMVGDYLFALASGEMALSPDPRVISFYSQAVMRICESELAPVPALRPFEQAREQYFTHTGGMAAALYEAACRSGAACGGLSAEQIEVLGLFGHQIGLALCIADELGDFAPDEARGSSLYHGLVTLPLIYAADRGDGARLEQALAAGDTDLDWALAEVRRYGLAPARAELSRCAIAARAALAEIAPSPARTALEQVADYVERS